MPINTSTSIKEVIARIVRNTGGTLPSEYHTDLIEWIGEAMGELRTTATLEVRSTPSCGQYGALEVFNHSVQMPCGLVELLAIEDAHGQIIPNGGDITDITNQSTKFHVDRGDNTFLSGRSTTFRTDTDAIVPFEPEEDGNKGTVPIYGEDLVQSNPSNIGLYYKVQMNTVQTSFEKGFIKIHYKGIPLDEEGYPLIPDNENYKAALYWSVMAKLIISGYTHPTLKGMQGVSYCNNEFEKYAGRALGEITYPSLDEMAKLNRSTVRLFTLPTTYDDFFISHGGHLQTFNYGQL